MILARLAAAAPSVFDPAVLSPKLWLDASDTSTITESGGAVSQWDNKGSLGNLTQGTAASQPTTGATTLNGLNVIDFAGDFMINTTLADWKFLSDGTDYVVAVVWKWNNSGARSYLITNFTCSSGVGFNLYIRDDSPNDEKLIHTVGNASGGGVFAVNNTTANNFVPINTWSVTSLLADPDNGTAADRSELFQNAGTAVKNNSSTGTPSASNPSNNFTVGALATPSDAMTGSIAELIIVDGANATETNRVILRNYLNIKWGVY